jgi:hypothetical protein
MRYLLLALLLLPLPAAAQTQATELGTHRSWSSYTYPESGSKVCFMASKPTKSLPAGARRGEIYAMVTHRPGQNSRGVVSFVAGYTFKSNSEVELTIGNQRFSLFTDGDTAWARDDTADRAILQAIRAGASMTVVGTSSRGTKTTDTYSLAGSSAALEAINKACGVN